MMQKILISLLIVAQTGCGIFWGEKAPAQKTLSAPESPPCPEFVTLARGTQQQADDTLACWRSSIVTSLGQVHGAKARTLSLGEVGSLIKQRILKLGGDAAQDNAKFSAIMRLLGWSDISTDRVEEWFAFMHHTLPEIRLAYGYATQGVRSDESFAHLSFISRVAQKILRRLPSGFAVEDLGHDIAAVYDGGAWVGATVSWISHLAPSLCPGMAAADRGRVLRLNDVISCVVKLTEHFAIAAPWWDWAFGLQEELPDVAKIREAMKGADQAAEAWFGAAGLHALSTQAALDWIAALGVPAPDDFKSSIGVLARLNRQSTPDALHPADLPSLLRLLIEIDLPILAVLGDYFGAMHSGQCREATQDWKRCAPKNMIPLLRTQRFYALKISYVPSSQGLIAPPDGQRFLDAARDWVLANRILLAFDSNADGILSASIGDADHNEAMNLITIMMRSGELGSSLLNNIDRRLKGLEPIEYVPNAFVRGLDVRSLAKVVTLAGTHSLVHRTRQESGFLNGLLENVTNLFPKSSIHLDQAGIFGVLTTLQMLPRYEKFVLKQVLGDPWADFQTVEVDRKLLLTGLEGSMTKMFPASSQSCEDFGLGPNCARVFERFVPPGDKLKGAELDAAFLIAMMLEGTFYHCDDDGDQALSLNVLNGDDELDCGYVRLKDLVLRLAESRVLPLPDGGVGQLKFALEFFNSTFLTRALGKVALARGTLSWPVANPLLVPFYGTATLGSIYSVILERTEVHPIE